VRKLNDFLEKKISRNEMWRIITTLEGEENDLKEVAACLQRLHKEISK
jgi:hypothetical protein